MKALSPDNPRSSRRGLKASQAVAEAADAGTWRSIAAWALLCAAVLVIYVPSVDGELIWDDKDIYLANNTLLRQADGIARFWFSDDPPDYYPLTYTTFWLEHRVVGLRTRLYHVDNILLHLATTGALYALLRRLGLPRPWFTVLLFAVHPLQLETVAWISQRKTLLGTLFGFAAAYDYVGASRGLSRASRWRGPLWFVLSLAGKPVLITLPPLLAAYDWLRGERSWRNIARRTAPYFAASLVFGVVGLAYQQKLIGGIDVREQDTAQRLASLGWAAWFYVLQTVRLDATSFVYPRWQVDATNFAAWLPDAAALALLWGTWKVRLRIGVVPFAAWGTYLVTMFPSLGPADVFFWRYSYVGDHYVYQSLPALLAAATWAGTRVAARRPSLNKALAAAGGAFALAAALFAWQRSFVFQSEERVWEETLTKNPHSALALSNLGAIRDEQGRTDEALELLARSTTAKPDLYEGWVRRGDVLAELRDWSAALEAYEQGLRFAPPYCDESFRAQVGAAESLLSLGRSAEAAQQLQATEAELAAANLDADAYLAALLCRARVFLWRLSGDAERQATLLAQIEAAVASSPEARYEAAAAWLSVGEAARSRDLWRRVLDDPLGKPPQLVHSHLAVALVTVGEIEAALPHFEAACRAVPDNSRMHANRALAYKLAKRPVQAVAAYRRTIELDPDDVAAKGDLAWLLAVHFGGDPPAAAEALRLARQCCAATENRHPTALDALGAALSADARFDEAAAAAERAVSVAAELGWPAEEVRPVKERAELYRRRQTYREQ